MRMKYDERLDYLNSIKLLKEKYKDVIEIESGYEIEYLPGKEKNLFELKNEIEDAKQRLYTCIVFFICLGWLNIYCI